MLVWMQWIDKMDKIIVFLIIFLVASSATWFFLFKGKDTKKVSQEGPIIFFGDSLTTGVGAKAGEDFPSVIAKELSLTNVVNAGVSGDTTADALARLKTDVLDKNPSLVIVFLGGNCKKNIG